MSLLVSCLFCVFCIVAAYPTVYPAGVTIYNKSEAYEGYTSLSVAGIEKGSSTVYIIDMQGNVLHEWFIGDGGTLNNIVLNDGRLISNHMGGNCPVMGCVSAIEERDWYGELVWSYENDHLHHPAEIMPDNNIIALFWDELPAELNSEVKGGIPGTEAEGRIYTDAIRIINRSKDVVWEWYPHENLNISDFPLSYSENRKYWPNINRVEYLGEDNPFNGKESLLVSFRAIDTIGVVEVETGELVWSWGRGIISHQHDPHLLSNGNIMVFDNGYLRANLPEMRAGNHFSRVVEINPRINQIIWQYSGVGPNLMRGFGFYSFIGGFAERLPNWNTLITETTTGRIFEVNGRGDIVWEYVHPISNVDSVHRFSADEVAWPEQLPKPDPGPDAVQQDGSGIQGVLYTALGAGYVAVAILALLLLKGKRKPVKAKDEFRYEFKRGR